MQNATVSLRSVVTIDDGYGNETTETTETLLEWAIIAPRSSDERTDSREPGVIEGATLYGPAGTVIDSDDLVVVSDHSPAMDGEWQVDGRPGEWKSPFSEWRPGFEVALRRAGEA